MADVYYNPEKFGLTTVGELDFSDGCFQFDYTVVWVDAQKNLYYADDSGCSCPSPFEGVETHALTKATVAQLQGHLRARKAAAYGEYVSDNAVVDLVNAARNAVS